jgi:uracil-DNA glycosylase
MMAKKDAASPQPPLPSLSLEELAKQAQNCRNCDLWRNATQTVFGEGSPRAPIMLVSEQPGDQEDLQGKPFVARPENTGCSSRDRLTILFHACI